MGSDKDLKRNEGMYVTDPIALFYVTANGNFVPIAIQLYHEKREDNPIWTPKGEKIPTKKLFSPNIHRGQHFFLLV